MKSSSRSSSGNRGNPIAHLVRRLSKTLSLSRTSVTSDSQSVHEADDTRHQPPVRLFNSRNRDRSNRSPEKRQATEALPTVAPLAPDDSFDIPPTESDAEPSRISPEDSESQTAVYDSSDSEANHDTPLCVIPPVFSTEDAKSNELYNFEYPDVERDWEWSSSGTIKHSSCSSESESRADEEYSDIIESDVEEDKVDIAEEEVVEGESVEDDDDEDEVEKKEVVEDALEEEEAVPVKKEAEEVEEDRSRPDEQEEKYPEHDSYQSDEYYPQFEVEHDPQQDPFHEASLVAESTFNNEPFYNDESSNLGSTVPPIILVTSPSNHDIPQKLAPLRPPPPPSAVKTQPQSQPEPPPVPSLPKQASKRVTPDSQPPPPPRPLTEPRSVPPRPEAPPASPSGKKKHGMFGISVGPLPSDRDPRFHFESHFEKKSIVPNPKKGLRNILSGEKRKQRLKRKEKAELDQIIQSGGFNQRTASNNDKVTPTSTAVATTAAPNDCLSSWQEFQARIEATVHDTTSRLESLKWAGETVGKTAEAESPADSPDASWANFEAHRGPRLSEDWAEFKQVSEEGVDDDQLHDTEAEQQNQEPEDADFGDFCQIRCSRGVEEEEERPRPKEEWPSCTSTDQPLEIEDSWAEFGADQTTADANWSDFAQELLITAEDHQVERIAVEEEKTPNEHSLINNSPSDSNWSEDSHIPTGSDEFIESHQSAQPSTSGNTMSSQHHYGYDEESSSQVSTAVFQSMSVEEPTVIEDNPPADSSTASTPSTPREHEYPSQYGYDNDHTAQGEIAEHSSDEVWSETSSSAMDKFVSDVIDTANAEIVGQDISPEVMRIYTNNTIPESCRRRPVRQGTLTENNPFRKASWTENPEDHDFPQNPEEIALEDEKTTLATVTLFSQAVHDEDDSECLEVDEQDGGLSNTPIEMPNAFDPFQTIYPTSDKGSSDDEETTSFPEVAIKPDGAFDRLEAFDINVPILPAPPKTSNPAWGDDEFEKETTDGLAMKEAAPTGWETFVDFKQQTNSATKEDAQDDDLAQAFEVDWESPPVPEAAAPEPPRPETPDPELEIPFHAPTPAGQVWRMWLRFPEKKKKIKQKSKYTTDRTWKEIAVTLSDDRGRCEVNLHEVDTTTQQHVAQPFRTLRMEPYMQLSRCKLQQYDKYGKLNIFKINHVTYRELPGMRPEKFSIKTFQNLISHKPRQNVALDHLPVYTEILKFGSMDRPLMRSLMTAVEDSLMGIPAHKDEGLNYSHEEICCYVIDEYVGRLSEAGIIEDQKARTRILCSAFVNGGPHIVLGINDKWRFGREVVRRSDILPVMHDDWITIWKPEFHSCLEMDDYDADHMLKFYPLDGCKFELMRFRVSLRQNRELPMHVHCSYSIDDRRVSMRCELLVPGYFTATGRAGAVPCEDIEIRIPVPEEWIYHFRVEKHHKMGSVHSTLRKPGRIKGLERITQMAQSLLPSSLMEASIGLAKYEHIFKAIVWRIPRAPEKNEASYRPHLLSCNLLLNPHDTVPEWDTLVKDFNVEFNMPSSTVSGTTVRSISVETTGNAEKFVKYTAKYRVTKAINYKLGHRNDVALKGILDEPEASEESLDACEEFQEEEGEEYNEEEEAESAAANRDGVFVDDLLGGSIPLPLASPSRNATQPLTSSSNDLADVFG